ncbi:MAG: hypothetical protein WD336_01740, partial [Trueperaceae bacterium]
MPEELTVMTTDARLLQELRIDALRDRDFLSLADLDRDAFPALLDSALTLKRAWRDGVRPRPLQDVTLAMIFEKQSLRTRSTFDIAM